MPMKKAGLRVLCLKSCIPSIDPILPPKIANRNKEASGILQALRLARDLSIPMRAKLTRLITSKYRRMYVMTCMLTPVH